MLVEGSSRFSWSFWLLNQASLSANAVSITLLDGKTKMLVQFISKRRELCSFPIRIKAFQYSENRKIIQVKFRSLLASD